MIMQSLPHPDDERLAAYAGRDPDALADVSLVAHLTACDRCQPLVDELSLLRGALAELPDLAPTRPLRLIPPVTAPAARGGSWLRRLTAPAMAVGAGLVLVGAVGFGASGAFGDFLGGAASGVFQNAGDNLEAAGESDRQVTASDSAYVPVPGNDGTPLATSEGSRGIDIGGSSEPPAARPSPESSPMSAAENPDDAQHLAGSRSLEQPWLTLLIAGAAIFVIATALRFSISPRG